MTKEENELMHMADLLAYHHANFEFRVVDQCDGIDRALDEYKKHLTEFASAIVKYRKKRNLNYDADEAEQIIADGDCTVDYQENLDYEVVKIIKVKGDL